jgi:two-component system nitrogen regulation response regulator NtrX
MHSILVIDDEQGIRDVLTDILQDEGYRVFAAEDGYKGLELLKTEPVDLVFLDIWLPGIGGIDVLQRIKDEFPGIEVVVISGHANIEMAVRAVKLGAYDLLEKPLSMDRILLQCRNIFELEQLRRENRALKAQLGSDVDMVGDSEGMVKIREIIAQAAGSNATVLITGENGTGKELVAREIHSHSNRRNAPFIAVNCAAIPENLIESELFGHEKGAFTGAVGRRKGKFELAHGGTLFLDEIADLSLSAQAKILRALQEKRVERLGGEDSLTVDVRIIAATNKPLREMIRSGEFREDLYYRLHVVPVDVPPLRERGDDIELLATHFLEAFAGGGRTFSPEALEALRRYRWPGNIRQFRNVVQRISVMSDDAVIPGEAVKVSLEGEMDFSGNGGDPVLRRFGEMSLGDAKDEFERQLILQKTRRDWV